MTSGIVFVLLPAGTFTMGAQGNDTDGANYVEGVNSDEGPPHRVTPVPFFLARHELTRGQWRRFGGVEDLRLYTGDDTYPVADVDWFACDALLRSRGLTLPTEAQWEYGCRAGTTTPWWTGIDEESVRGEVEDLRPVGNRVANAFGLFNVHGNVEEWCADRFWPYSRPWRQGDGLRLGAVGVSPFHVLRGGAWGSRHTRSARRNNLPPAYRGENTGVRAARTLQP